MENLQEELLKANAARQSADAAVAHLQAEASALQVTTTGWLAAHKARWSSAKSECPAGWQQCAGSCTEGSHMGLLRDLCEFSVCAPAWCECACFKPAQAQPWQGLAGMLAIGLLYAAPSVRRRRQGHAAPLQ